MAQRYYNIVFLQNDFDFDSFDGGAEAFFDADTDVQFAFLSQWDYGDYDQPIDVEPWGRDDFVETVEVGTVCYYLTTNAAMGYAGLTARF